jgi:hypothetical protein
VIAIELALRLPPPVTSTALGESESTTMVPLCTFREVLPERLSAPAPCGSRTRMVAAPVVAMIGEGLLDGEGDGEAERLGEGDGDTRGDGDMEKVGEGEGLGTMLTVAPPPSLGFVPCPPESVPWPVVGSAFAAAFDCGRAEKEWDIPQPEMAPANNPKLPKKHILMILRFPVNWICIFTPTPRMFSFFDSKTI